MGRGHREPLQRETRDQDVHGRRGAKDGLTGELFIVQARPETVHGGGKAPTLRIHRLKERGPVLVEGLAVGNAVATGPAGAKGP